MVLCVLQVTLNVTLRLLSGSAVQRTNSSGKERDELENKYNTILNERNRLQEDYNNLLSENQHLLQNLTEAQHRLTALTAVCRPGWVVFGSSCYFVSSELKSWDEGRQDCLKKGADLAIINSRTEQNFIHGLNFLWIGLHESHTGVWTWVDGTPLTNAYWLLEVNSPAGRGLCALTDNSSPSVSSWKKRPCTDNIRYVCELCICRT
ncbi:C-type lectin domain family 4 member M-like isoform X2 [Colossoma macropomum]|nr:C-type lectin domain family 4 member M-like isoform X2 [Colossoma macropomum]